MQVPIPSRDELWKQYELHVELLKFYLKLTIEINVFYYAITGALLSYYFSHLEVESVKYALILPLLMSVLFGLLFIYGAVLNRASRREVFAIRTALGLQTAPEVAVLGWLLAICSVLMLTIALGLGAILCGCIDVA